ncbi:hypothetical protein [Nocardioides litoris]|uniref:hypothetical protein n=1 Tax=Nocardioides litoris TaxID=1926648 RepID=UPI00111E80A1|nr:hypothetical protein [Nocardioides litoris]
MSVEQTIQMINQACDDMVDAYATLAESAAPAMDELTTTIGRIRQWKYVSRVNGGPPMTEYRDTQYNGWEKAVMWFGGMSWTEEEVPHPRADEARARVQELLGVANANDAQFELDMDDIAQTPRVLGQLLGGWLTIRDTFTQQVAQGIPSDVAYIPTSGSIAGWSSPSAAAAYATVVGSQNSAADTAVDVMSGLLDNAAAFLASLQESLAGFAALTLDLDRYYSDLVSKGAGIVTGMEKPSFGLVSDAIDLGFTAVNGLKEQEVSTAQTFGSMLNSTIQALLQIETLSNEINGMGETSGENGWPAPIAVTYTDEGDPTDAQLVTHAQYFLDHAAFWDDMSSTLSTLSTQAGGTVELPVMYTRVPTFSADQSIALNGLSNRLETDVLRRGSTQTAAISTKLRQVMETYLQQEAANAEQIRQVKERIGA